MSISKYHYQLDFPDSLPVCARRDEIMNLMREHQVIIVCGETGSGKTTQLPKIALALGRGSLSPDVLANKSQNDSKESNKDKGNRRKSLQRSPMIGHTQPRRIAASSVAKRIAQELQTPLGDVVGFKVRFQDRISPSTQIKLMTDGILLAETQTDPLLKAYDTLIIDEAHERSLNIDFLLGYIKQILPRRPDLKVVVTSATIDAERFSQHFSSAKGCAPVVMVSGRTFPVEQRWRPFEESRDFGLNEAISDAVDELWNGQNHGDILIFLPGEREIREAADHLRGHLTHHPIDKNTEILPLFARLSQAEQDRIFDSHSKRRIVLATNVAETSLTVPGIRYVIDAGSARVKRYSLRSKVEQLLIEPISQAAANQRAGRCGRVANGICIRLYDEADFQNRDRFTDPEILRSSLAGVILRMKSLHLTTIEEFPFIDAPSGRAIADGYQLLAELGALDFRNELTEIGKELARVPLDPRVGRMILEARSRSALNEVLVIAAALSIQDVRDRPMDSQAQADQAHAKFDDERSEFSGYLTLWNWLNNARGGCEIDGQAVHKLSHRQYEALLRKNFINPRRVREWRDIHSQLLTVVTEHRWQINSVPATYEQLHLSMLSGLLGNIGCKHHEEDIYVGARAIKFHRHPGAHLRKKSAKWIVCAELIETSKLFGRGIANIEPPWLEQIGSHLVKKQLLDPHWEKRSGEVVAFERATLYGLLIYSGKRTSYAKVDEMGAREIFIRQALVAGEIETRLPFLVANQKMIAKVEELEHKSRRQDVLVDEELIYAFYDQNLPKDVFSLVTLEYWHKEEHKKNPQHKILHITKEALMRHEASAITNRQFPRFVRLGGVDCQAHYLHEVGHAKDGLTVTIPIFVLNQVNDERCEWLVLGMLKDKIQVLIKSLPQKIRARLVPLPESAARLTELLSDSLIFGSGSLVDALILRVREITQLDVKRSDFKLEMLPAHLLMNFQIIDENNRQLGSGRNLSALKADLGQKARGAFQALAHLKLAAQMANSENIDSETNENPANAIKNKANSLSVSKHSTSKYKESLDHQRDHAPEIEAKSHQFTEIRHSREGGNDENGSANIGTKSYTKWDFGELPELMEIRKNKQVLVGFPALIDKGDCVTIEVFDEPQTAKNQHQLGLRRLFALQIKDALRYLEKSIAQLQNMAVFYMPIGSIEELRLQIVDLALDRAFLQEPLPNNALTFDQRIKDGRARLTLIANEIARLAHTILMEFSQTHRKLKDSKPNKSAANAAQMQAIWDDCSQQLERLMPKLFLKITPFEQLQHFPRYLKAISHRLEKCKTNFPRDTEKMAEVRLQEQRFYRLLAERKGVLDVHAEEFRWLLEELRVSFFAQELKTPQPVSVKRLEKVWILMNR